MLIRALLITTALILIGPAIAQENAPSPSEKAAPAEVTDPAQFASIASVSSMFEIESSKLAQEKASSDEVKAFAEQMIADHTKAGEDMTRAATEEGVAPATELDQQHQEIMDNLSSLSGEEFDMAYIQAQVQAHDEAVALFDGYSSNGQDGALKQFAAATLPALEEHQAHAHELAGH